MHKTQDIHSHNDIDLRYKLETLHLHDCNFA